jgi:hypothetical protein
MFGIEIRFGFIAGTAMRCDFGESEVDHVRGYVRFMASQLIQIVQDTRTGLYCSGFAAQLKDVAAICDFQFETIFELAKVFIEASAKVGETLGIVRLQLEPVRVIFTDHECGFWPPFC